MADGDMIRRARSVARKVKRRVQAATNTPDAAMSAAADGVVRVTAGGDRTEAVPRRPRAKMVTEAGVLFQIADGEAKVTGLEEGVVEAMIPAEVAGAVVTTIGREAFQDSVDLIAVRIPESLTVLGARAFVGCTSLTDVELPSDLTVINASAFEGCTALERVILPHELQRIARRAFAGCTALAEMPHYVKTGISIGLTVDRTIVEEAFPTELRHIGEEAFSGCGALRKVVIPFRTEKLPRGVFRGCTALETVWLHAGITEIGAGAFAACRELDRISVPAATETIGEGAFPAQVTIVCAEGSAARAHAESAGLRTSDATAVGEPIHSAFGATASPTVADVVASPESTQAFLDRYALRPAAEPIARPDTEMIDRPSSPSRFRLRDGVYEPIAGSDAGGEVTLSMVGDLMCRFRQQETALVDGEFDFSESFRDVKPLLEDSDLAIGNLEAMLSTSVPYMFESKYVEDRPHLNAPPAFAAAVRDGGFDMVLNAQNHMYDAGAQGVLETLDALNRAELIHGGLYASPEESRFQLFRIKGITLGVVSYLDGARQKMKQANFTPEGLAATASPFDAERVREDIAAAREAGAEFVLAYAHWGREYTDHITQRQQRFARMLVDGGVDYVFGSHSHCPQPYTIMTAQDGKRVPVIYSGGNFVSDIGLARPITQDTFVARLTLGRDAGGSVQILRDGYVPCRIVEGRDIRGFVRVVPCDELISGTQDYSQLQAEEDVSRISAALGRQYSRLAADGSPMPEREDAARGMTPEDELVDAYALREPAFLRQEHVVDAGRAPSYRFDASSEAWRREHDTSVGEAILVCAGSILYDSALERAAEVGDRYEFRSHFRHVREALGAGDLAVGSLGTIVADMYPPMSVMARELARGHYANARPEYLDALRFAGFDCLALANPYNLDAGVRGVAATERAVLESGIVPSGIGRKKTPIIDVNGIRIAVFSLTLNEYSMRTYLTEEGAGAILNVFDEQRARVDIATARETGAEFVLVYLDCRSSGDQLRFADRLAAGRTAAEAGADYVICVQPHVLSKHRTHTTADGRAVPIATGLGTFMAGPTNRVDASGALLKIAVRRRPDGGVEIADTFLPLKRCSDYAGTRNAIVSADATHNPSYDASELGPAAREAAEKLGEGIAPERPREVSVRSQFRPQVTPAEIAEILGVAFSDADRRTLGDAIDRPVENVALRQEDLRRGGVAVFVRRPGKLAETEQISPAHVHDVGSLFAIATAPQRGLPTLVVPNALAAYETIVTSIRAKYDPVTVAITGTVGKTTAKELMAEAFHRHFRTLVVRGNNNTLVTVGQVVQKLTPDYEAYIQEVHGGSPASAHRISRVIRPDVALITAIGDGHLAQMGSIEKVVEGKMQIIDGLKDGGVLVINHDNEHLKHQEPPVRTVRYSVEDASCDYFARDIRDTGERLEFQIVAPDGVFEAKLNFQGVHNVSNALGVFAASREAGIPPHTIIAGMSRFVPDTVRQNLAEVGGYRLLIDTYSSTPMSVLSAVRTLSAVPVAEGSRRIAVLGDAPDLGVRAKDAHIELGEQIADLDVDLVLCCGEASVHLVEAARKKGMNAHFFAGRAEFNRKIVEESRPGDVLLFKGGMRVKLLENTVHPLFGRIV
ncbi:MAG: CapA family protein [Microbacterium sp.]